MEACGVSTRRGHTNRVTLYRSTRSGGGVARLAQALPLAASLPLNSVRGVAARLAHPPPHIPHRSSSSSQPLPLNSCYRSTHLPLNSCYRSTHLPLNSCYRSTHLPLNSCYRSIHLPLNSCYRSIHLPLNSCYRSTPFSSTAQLLLPLNSFFWSVTKMCIHAGVPDGQTDGQHIIHPQS